MVAAVVHRDESAPHLAAYVVPLVEVAAGTRRRSVFVGKGEDGKPLRETRAFPTPAGVRLSAAHYVGTRNKLRAFQDDMGAIGERHGLRRGTPGSSAKHTTIKEFYQALNGPKLARPPSITPDELVPRSTPRGWLRRPEQETPEQMAARLNATRDAIAEQLAEQARTARIDRERAAQAFATAQAAAEREGAAKGELEALAAELARTQENLRLLEDQFTVGLTDEQIEQVAALSMHLYQLNRPTPAPAADTKPRPSGPGM